MKIDDGYGWILTIGPGTLPSNPHVQHITFLAWAAVLMASSLENGSILKEGSSSQAAKTKASISFLKLKQL